MTDCRLPDLFDKAVADVLTPVVHKKSVLVSDGAGRYGRFANAAGILHVSLNASAGERTWGVYHIKNVNAYASRLKSWIHPFKGVATERLPNYLGWHRLMDRETGAPSPTACLAAALN